jgi:hypothetical protein
VLLNAKFAHQVKFVQLRLLFQLLIVLVVNIKLVVIHLVQHVQMVMSAIMDKRLLRVPFGITLIQQLLEIVNLVQMVMIVLVELKISVLLELMLHHRTLHVCHVHQVILVELVLQLQHLVLAELILLGKPQLVQTVQQIIILLVVLLTVLLFHLVSQ